MVVGIGLSVLCGHLALDRWTLGTAAPSSETVVIEGTVEWAGWRKSAHPDGPVWFLQLRLTTDSRGFLVAAADLSEPFRTQLRRAGPPKNGARLSSLIGTEASIRVAPRFQEPPRLPTPYVRTLRIDGAVVLAPESSPPSNGSSGRMVSVLVGMGMLVGVGVTGVSVHHLVVCVRHRTARP
ncbi:MAG: hypothetical protein BRD55_09990 [Bacteroidetes bacterium SW_9_63_38]|nr:MAG: hypothetical protein BRD55_09990 [Bacteroidetes bacterium SW_9_63_38]